MASVQVSSTTGYAQRIQVGRHALVADEPVSNGGADSGPSPYALLLSSLGACTSITLLMYARRKGWTLGEVEVSLRMQKDLENNGQGDRIERTVSFSAPLSEEQRARLAEICEKTPVTRTIRAGTPIATTLAGP
ncbi:MAG TPA: OsmC family protein [Polyangia bacterium]|nr:OsmC family protein [Polyangia bacterium]